MDCNNFFVSCERLFRPDLWHKPVAVLSSNDGCIVARSNEVKAMGIPMGMPLFQAKQLVDLSQVTLFSSNFTLYRDISSRVMRILEDEVGECEVYSVDEAFFRLPKNTTEGQLRDLRQRIVQKVGIPVSIGLAETKTLAKVASEVEKKGCGYCLLSADKWQVLADHYPCAEVWNLGRATTKKLKNEGVETAAQFMSLDQAYVQSQFGVAGRRVQDELKGVVIHNLHSSIHEVQQSIMHTRSFAKTTSKQHEVESALIYHVTQAAAKLREKKLLATKLYVLARPSRHSDFILRQSGKEVVLPLATNSDQLLIKETLLAFREFYDSQIPYKKAGVTLSGLVPENHEQLGLFTDEKEKESRVVDQVVDALNSKFGLGTLRSAAVLSDGPKTGARMRSNEYTTRWGDIPRVAAK